MTETAVPAALAGLRETLAPLAFALTGDEQADWRARRDRIAADIDGHIARLRDLEAPLLVVFGGVTGAGKSTLLNSVAGEVLAVTGVIRPTTYGPTLATAPGDLGWFSSDRILPDLPRVQPASDAPRAEPRPGALTVLVAAGLPAGLAVVDAPDVDSVAEANRDLADQLLDAADVWLWITSAGKYADEESMRYLRRAAARRTVAAVALTQVASEDEQEIVDDFRRKLAAEQMGDVDLFVIPFVRPEGQRLADPVIEPLRRWLGALADRDTRIQRRRQTLEGALDALPGDVDGLIAGLDHEARVARALIDDADRAYRRAREDFADALEQGLPLRHEVLARWNSFVGGGRFLRLAEEATGQARAWVKGLLIGPVAAEEARLEREVRREVGDTVQGMIVQLSDLAAASTADAWAGNSPGRGLLDAYPALKASDPGLGERAAASTAEWQQSVIELVQTQGAERKVQARWLSTAINAAATGAIVIALAHTGGLTGTEAGIATAAGAANQALLVKLLGERNLRWLIGQAKADLIRRFDELMTAERRRFTAAVADAAPEDELRDDIRAALTALRSARR
ncbi:MAG TPA: hypothetical protein VML96_08580 [Egibacteraceae bacterium]|nr:hypothetical protein [Egibacteraceae bacterium]